MRRVLVLESSDTLRQGLLLGLRGHGIDAEGVEGVDQAGPPLAAGRVGTAVLGPGGGSVAGLVGSLPASPSPVAIIAVVDGTWNLGFEAIRHGAADFVPLSAGSAGVALAVQKIEAHRAARAGGAGGAGRPGDGGARESEPANRHAGAGSRVMGGGGAVPAALIGNSPKILAVLRMVGRLAGVRAGVLVGGESGTGKELIAHALHDQSPWSAGPFVAVNCGAIPAGLIESELFGHVRGSFTDAVRDKQGLFEAADGGTLFLDEIADLPLLLQSKLLRAVQDGVIRKVGEVDDVRVDVRVVAATARDLTVEVREGRFREDLYYRLAALSIQLPALRERRDDIPLLAAHFLARARAKLGCVVNGIDDQALRLLVDYQWPGNVRELENTIERAAVLTSGDRVDVESLPDRLSPPAAPATDVAREGPGPALGPQEMSIKQASRRFEEELIRRALASTGGNRTRAAELLEISHRALLYKIKEYGITVKPHTRDAPRKATGP